MAVSTSKHRYKVLIFDLDDTLFDTSGMLVKPALREAAAAMAALGLNATPEMCAMERIHFLKASPRGDLFAHLVNKFGIKEGSGASPEQIRETGSAAFYKREVEKNIFPYPRVREILADLSVRYLIFLVTMGDPSTQKQKVENLKIGSFFRQIFYVAPNKNQTKTDAFAMIMKTTGLKPDEFLCIGNRLDLEISQGKALGLQTCLVQTGDHRDVVPHGRLEQPDYKIEKISEIMKVCRL
jgi:putative hydrolase of the HAD superfamily